ncbi:YcaO-like family protein [Streptomyces microflavus]
MAQARGDADGLAGRLRRWEVPGGAEHPGLPALLASSAAQRLVCAVAGIRDPSAEAGDARLLPGLPTALVAEQEPLRGEYRSWPGPVLADADRVRPPAALRTLAEALARIPVLTDSRTGVLDEPEPGSLPQLPAALVRCTTADGDLVSGAARADLARLEAVCRAAELRLGNGETGLTVGAGAEHARGRALRRAAIGQDAMTSVRKDATADGRAGETAGPDIRYAHHITTVPWSPETARHPQALHWWSVLIRRLGVDAEVAVSRLDTGGGGVFRARVRGRTTAGDAPVLLGTAVEASVDNAVAFAALCAVVGFQRAADAPGARHLVTPSGASAALARSAEPAPWEDTGWTTEWLAEVAGREPDLQEALTGLTGWSPQPWEPPAGALDDVHALRSALRQCGFPVLSARPASGAHPHTPWKDSGDRSSPAPPGFGRGDPHRPRRGGRPAPHRGQRRRGPGRLDPGGGGGTVAAHAAPSGDARPRPGRRCADRGGARAAPRRAGCLSCSEYRRLATIGGRVPWHSPGLRLEGRPSPAFVDAVAVLAASLQESGEAVVHVVHNGRGTWSTHRFEPVGGCAVCLPLPPDGTEVAEAAFGPDARRAPRPASDPESLREPNPRTGVAGLREVLFDERFGPVHQILRTEESVHSLTSAYVTYGRHTRDGGYGRSIDFETSERVALFEAAERLASMSPTGHRTVLRAPYAELGPERAVDPVRLGLPDPVHHGHPASATVPYTPDLELDWVHGWSLTRDRTTAVPEHVAYWDASPGRPRVVYECSSGCGLGNSAAEAALYGLFEVAERDAFLMAWYARTPLRRVAVPAGDLEVAHLVDRAALAGYRVALFDATNDFQVPAVIAVALHRGEPATAPGAFVAAGSHHHPRAAIRSAVAEVVTNVVNAVHRHRAEPEMFDRRRLLPMLERPELVTTLADHVAVNTLPEARSRLDFLDPDGPETKWQDIWPEASEPAPVPDVTRLLEETVNRLAGLGLEVVAVPLSESAVRDRLGLHTAKVVVPGSLPMTFGHVNRRTIGLDRLLEVPFRLGRTQRRARHDELALHPHPFP